MQQKEELNWVGSVLGDVVTFLAQNDLMDSAKMLAIAAAHIEHDMRREKPVPQAIVTLPANVLMFPNRNSRFP